MLPLFILNRELTNARQGAFAADRALTFLNQRATPSLDRYPIERIAR
jgi:hypothetical protein